MASLKWIRKELAEKGKYPEAILAYKAWQQNHHAIRHVVDANIKLLQNQLDNQSLVDSNAPRQKESFRSQLLGLGKELSTSHDLLKKSQPGGDYSLLNEASNFASGILVFYLNLIEILHQHSQDFFVFDENAYLAANEDVRDAIANGDFESGRQHFDCYGESQRRAKTVAEVLQTSLDDVGALVVFLCSQHKAFRAEQLVIGASTAKAFLSKISPTLSSFLVTRTFTELSHPKEIRRYSEDAYLWLNGDLQAAVQIDGYTGIKSHYHDFGKHENRLYSHSHLSGLIIHDTTLLTQKLSSITSKPVKASNTTRDIFASTEARLYNINFTNFSCAVHVHVYYIDVLAEILTHIDKMPFEYDLYVTYSEGIVCPDQISAHLNKAGLEVAANIQLIEVANRGRNLGPLATVLSPLLINYKYIAHVHTKHSGHSPALANWRSNILTALFANKAAIRRIVYLLQESTDMVIPPNQNHYIKDPTGWADNKDKAMFILSKCDQKIHHLDSPVVFPEGGMFWTNATLYAKIRDLGLRPEDFEEEPIPQDGSAAHALERLIGLLAMQDNKPICQVQTTESNRSIAFEEHIDYKEELAAIPAAKKCRIFAFFLPQFHETPQNNAWHGEGFTEWTNVKKTNPLFPGHYQQRFPHPDFGYYHLDDKGYFKNLEHILAKSGVDALILYHYWFGGTSILEEPARLLLNSTDINIHWCFCWANENWTRAWDGNENEVLMKQTYSREDAKTYINHLIPFFKDNRYVKINSRPVLIVYRAAHNPLMKEYCEIWGEECRKSGLQTPYLICTLTRGAKNPYDYNFDAGLERVLHDWTDGNVGAVNASTNFFDDFNGSVLLYKEVAEYYSNLDINTSFPHLRSIIPSWDNTPRYGPNAYIIHDSSPEKFSNWFNAIYNYTLKHLQDEERIIVVNAWNEWAESAYLEPDLRYGYAYLNSIARVKLGYPYNTPYRTLCDKTGFLSISTLAVILDIPDHVLKHLRQDVNVNQRFWQCLKTASKQSRLIVSEQIYANLSDEDRTCFSQISKVSESNDMQTDYRLTFRRIEYLMPFAIDRMLALSAIHPGHIIVANSIQYSESVVEVSSSYAVHPESIYSNLCVILSLSETINADALYIVCPDAVSFPCSYIHLARKGSITAASTKVNTIIRMHHLGSLKLLEKALFSLFIMEGQISVQPILACQDISYENILYGLESVISQLPWSEENKPILVHYSSSSSEPDCRARMLVEPLQHLTSNYFAYLDHDDHMYPNAYQHLISRLQETGKAISFGRVFVAQYSTERQLITAKARDFEYGFSYDEYLRLNNAPIHSFLINASDLNLSAIEFIPGMRYMEDYYFTLQIFREGNCDWQALVDSECIADYCYATGAEGSGTLSSLNDNERFTLTSSDEYLECEHAINELRSTIRAPRKLLSWDS
jgi:lipopolysaccharide biosynthesis protein